MILLVILVAITQFQTPFDILDRNEEHYFLLAETNQEDSQNKFLSSAGYGASGHRYVFDKIVTTSIEKFGYEITKVLFRSLLIMAVAFSLRSFFSVLNLNVFQIYILLTSLLLLQDLQIFNNQSFYGGERIFGGFESRSIAYVFIILSLKYILDKKYMLSTILISIATNVHFLVGGWFFFAYLIFIIIKKKNAKEITKIFFLYCILAFPILYQLYNSFFLPSDLGDTSAYPSIDWIYSFLRNPHHVVPFYKGGRLNWMRGISIAILSLFMSLRYIKYGDHKKSDLAIFNSIIIIITLINIIISFMDSNYIFGKFYLFRLSALSLFFSIIIIFFYLDRNLNDKLQNVYKYAALTLFLLIMPKVFANVVWNYPHQTYSTISFIKENTSENDIILIDKNLENTFIPFERLSKRNSLVYHAYIPTTKFGILEWYKRNQFKKSIFSGKISEHDYPYHYLITDKRKIELEKIHGAPIYSNKYFVYKNGNIKK